MLAQGAYDVFSTDRDLEVSSGGSGGEGALLCRAPLIPTPLRRKPRIAQAPGAAMICAATLTSAVLR